VITNLMRSALARGVVIAVAAVVTTLGVAAGPASADPRTALTGQCTTHVVSSEGWVPSTANGNTHCWMARGSYSVGVWALQMSLVFCYGQNVGPNGPDRDYGGATVQAVKNVQGAYGIRKDGEYGPQTRGVMKFYPACV
jgi:peptidoglycan hydrolase-like protein with peptidoglycan-binding domain